MSIGIIGVGGQGRTLALRLAKLGYEVTISNSRGPESMVALANEIGATPVPISEAIAKSDIVIVSIPTKAVIDLGREQFQQFSDSATVIDTCNYHPQLRDGPIDAIDRGMPESEWVALQLGCPVIKAFNSIFADSLLEKGVPSGADGRIALPVAGDDANAKKTAIGLIDELGFDPVDAGGLEESWRQQAGAPAYCKDLEAGMLRSALAEAEHDFVAEYRAREEARIKQSMGA